MSDKTKKNAALRIFGLVSLIILVMCIHANFNHHLPHLDINYPSKTLVSLIPSLSHIIIQKRLNKTLAIMLTDGRTAYGEMDYKCISHILYFENIHTRFILIPKTGNHNWREALLIANSDIQQHSTSYDELVQTHGYSNRYLLDALNLEMDSESLRGAFTFTVMRNPWTRMVSGYKDKLAEKNPRYEIFDPIARQIVGEIRGITDETKAENMYPTFKEFVKWLIKHDGVVNFHFMPQTRIMCLKEVTYDYIVPLEYAEEYSREIWDMIQVNTSLSRSYDGNDAASQSSTVDARKWFSELDTDIIDKLYDLFRYDFAIMNYSNFTNEHFPYPLL